MRETRIFLEIIKSDDDNIFIGVGGGILNNGQLESYNNIENAITDVKNRAYASIDKFKKGE